MISYKFSSHYRFRVFSKNSSNGIKVQCYSRIFWKRLYVWIKNSHRLSDICSRRILNIFKQRTLQSQLPNEHPVDYLIVLKMLCFLTNNEWMKEGILFVIKLKKKSITKINFLLLICRISADQPHCQEEPKFMVDLDMTFSLQVRNAMKIFNYLGDQPFFVSPPWRSVFFCTSLQMFIY